MKKTEAIASLYEEMAQSAIQDSNVEPWVRRRQIGDKLPRTTLDLGMLAFDLALWAATAEPHPITPRMKQEEYESLKEGILKFGLCDGDIVATERGNVVDGFHRMRCTYELLKAGHTLPPPMIRFVRFHTQIDEETFVILRNVTRRQISNEAQRKIVTGLLRSGHHGTDGFLARLCGLDDETVRDIRHMLEGLPVEEGGIEWLPERKNERGKRYAQKKREPKSLKRRDEVRRRSTSALGQPGCVPPESPDLLSISGSAQHDQVSSVPEVGSPRLQMEILEDAAVVTGVIDEDNSGSAAQGCLAQQERATIESEANDFEAPADAAAEASEETPPAPKEHDDEVAHEPVSADAALSLLVSHWWDEYHFLPVMSRELHRLSLSLEDHDLELPVTKGGADRMTRTLKGLVGTKIGGHLVLSRTLSAGVAVFMLSPIASAPIDETTLLRHAGGSRR